MNLFLGSMFVLYNVKMFCLGKKREDGASYKLTNTVFRPPLRKLRVTLNRKWPRLSWFHGKVVCYFRLQYPWIGDDPSKCSKMPVNYGEEYQEFAFLMRLCFQIKSRTSLAFAITSFVEWSVYTFSSVYACDFSCDSIQNHHHSPILSALSFSFILTDSVGLTYGLLPGGWGWQDKCPPHTHTKIVMILSMFC